MQQIQITNNFSTSNSNLNYLIELGQLSNLSCYLRLKSLQKIYKHLQRFTNINRLFVLSFTRNNAGDNRDSFSHYYVPNVMEKVSLTCQ